MSPNISSKIIKVFIILLIIAFPILNGFFQLIPPPLETSEIPLTEFSTGRALKYLEVITKDPHPVGSTEHANVRDFILKTLTELGLTPQVQKSDVTYVSKDKKYDVEVENIVVRINGTSGEGKIIMLVTHYDTVPGSPGAADDGFGVATLLETARALKAGAPLQNNILLLFSDGEELGLLGSKAFAVKNSLKNISMVSNLEARGNAGPSIMFETGEQNELLINEFRKVAFNPVAYSFSYDVYKFMPNNTDFTVFKNAGLPGLNFSNIEGFYVYHSPLDKIKNIDPRTLHHLGSNIFALTRHFGNLNLEENRLKGNAVYFNIFRSTMVVYAEKLVFLWAGLACFLFVIVVLTGFKEKLLSLKGVLWGCVSVLVNLITIWLIINALLVLLTVLFKERAREIFMNPLYSDTCMVAFIFVTVATVFLFWTLFSKKVSVHNGLAGILLIWVTLTILSSIYLKGLSYLFTWPLLFSSIGAFFFFFSKTTKLLEIKYLTGFFLTAVPVLTLFTPVIYLIYRAMTLVMADILMLVLVFPIGLILPYLLPNLRSGNKGVFSGNRNSDQPGIDV